MKIVRQLARGAVDTSLERISNRGRLRIAHLSLARAPIEVGGPVFEKPVLVGTFHKTGTVLLRKVLRKTARFTGFKLWDAKGDNVKTENWDVCFHWQTSFGEFSLDPRNYPTAVMIRDPRDIIVSAANYHLSSGEGWLHVKHEKFGGKTYQEAIRECADPQARYRFELANSAGNTLRRMRETRLDPAFKDALFLKLEDLVTDTTLTPYWQLFDHLGMSGVYRPIALSIAYENSLFNKARDHGGHVKSGKPAKWKTELDAGTLDMFYERFPDLVELLGYE